MALATQSGVARRSATQSDAEVGNGGKIEEVALNLLRVAVPEKKPRTRLNVLGNTMANSRDQEGDQPIEPR